MKKVVSLLLVLVLVLGMGTVGFAAADKIDKSMTKGLGTWMGGDSSDLGEIAPDSKVEIPLTSDMFAWINNGTAVVHATTAVTESELRGGKITFKTSVRAGSKVMRDLSVETKTFGATSSVGALKTAYVRFRFVKTFRSVEDVDFDITIYPVVDGKRQDDYAFNIIGTLVNPTVEVDDLDDYVDSSQGFIVHANAYIKLIEVDTGEGLSVWTKMFNDKKYWGVTTRDPDDADDVIFSKHPDVDVVYNLDTIGLSSTAQYITLNDVGGDFYVYDKDLKFIGMSNEKLPYSNKYYLAHTKLNIDDDDDDEPIDDGDEPEPPPITGGDDYVDNINDNPGTGR